MSFIRPGRASASIAIISGAIDRLSITTETATPEQIGIYAPTTASVAAGSTVTMRYRTTTGPGTWNTAHPLLRISTTGNETDGPTTLVDSFGGSIFDLTPGTQYDVELTHVESGQSTKTTTIQSTTRSLPAISGATSDTANSAGTIATKFASFTGNVLTIADGTYDVSSLVLSVSGSDGTPKYIRGTSRAGTIIRDTTGTVLSITGSHLVLENLTITGSSTDSGTAASSVGVLLNGSLTNITVRNCDITGVDQGIVSGGSELTKTLIYGNVLTGNNPWSEASNGNATWNDTGIEMPGFGNCAWNNTLSGFGDSFAVTRFFGDGLRAEGIHFYRNRVLNNGDDLIEFDYGTRNLSCYDNVVTNTATAMSSSYQYGGPSYYFRNLVVNTIRTPYKINGGGTGVTGFIIYNNTVVRTDGSTSGWGMIQSAPDGAWQNYSFRNNLLVYRGSASGGLMALEQGDNNPCDFDYNAWYPAGASDDVWWTNSGGSFASLAAARSGLPGVTPLFGSSQRHTNDISTVTNPFTNAITLGATHATEYTATPDATLSASGPKNLGVAIPGITDGFSGAAPDIGSVITGRTQPSVGALPVYVLNASLFTWVQLPNTKIQNAGAPRGTGAWSGAVYDESRRNFIFNGGGHNDSSNNGVWAVRLGQSTPDPVQLKAGSSSTPADVSYNPDGTPSARHTYWHLQYVASLDAMMQFGGAAISGTGNFSDDKVNRFNLSTNTWSPSGTHTSRAITAGAGEGVCQDSSGNVYVWRQDAGRIDKWTAGTPGSWATLSTGLVSSWDECMAYDPTRNRLVCFSAVGNSVWVNPSTGGATSITFSGPSASVAAERQTTWWYVPERDSFFGSSGLGNVYECNANTYSVSPLSVSGTTPQLDSAKYGRFNIARDMGIVLFTDWEEVDTYFFRYR